jgi:SpoIID/LytB domain protein
MYILVAAGILACACVSPSQPSAEKSLSGAAGGDAPEDRAFAYPLTEEGAARAYYEGETEECVRIFEKLLSGAAADGRDTAVKKQLVTAYYETGDYEKLIPLLEGMLEAEPGAEVRRELFTALCLAGDTGRALSLLPLSPVTSETLFYEALLRRDTGDNQKAAELLKQSLAARDFNPIGWFFLGQLLAPSSLAEAEECYRKALGQDAGLTEALFPLGGVLFAQKRYREAYGFLLRAKNSFPDNPEIAAMIEQTLDILPELTEEQKTAAGKRKSAAVPPKVKAQGKETEGLVLVRVGLAEKLGALSVKTGGAYTLTDAGNTVYEGKALDLLTIEIADGEISIKNEEKILAFSRGPLVLAYCEEGNTTIVFDFLSEAGYFFAVTEDRVYRGTLEFRPAEGGITLINALNIEEYLYAVIPSEMPASWPEEALKAQAIAHRSYTLAHLGQYAAKGFDVYGSVLSAAYRGVGGEAPKATAAVDSSRGVYLTAGGLPLKAYYSANHGGYSEDSAVVWGGADTFMAAVADKLIPPRETWLPLDQLDGFVRGRPPSYSSAEKLHSAAAYRWEKWVRAEDIKNRVAAEGLTGDIVRIVSRGRGISGRVREVQISGTEGSVRVSGDRIRSRLGGLRSNLFTIRTKTAKNALPEYFIFRGAGWGHGVGMDQSGAAGMAQAGYTAEEILLHYYPRAELARPEAGTPEN